MKLLLVTKSLIQFRFISSRTHMEDMIEVTKAIHYENYRRLKLTEKKRVTSPSPASSTGEVAANV